MPTRRNGQRGGIGSNQYGIKGRSISEQQQANSAAQQAAAAARPGSDRHASNLTVVNHRIQTFDGQDLRRMNLSGRDVYAASFREVTGWQTRLDNIQGDETDWSGSDIHCSTWEGARLRRTNMGALVAVRSRFDGIDGEEGDYSGSFPGTSWREANIPGSRGMHGSWRDVNAEGADLRDSDWYQWDFSGADLSRVAHWEGWRLSRCVHDERTRWPKGFTPAPHQSMLYPYDQRIADRYTKLYAAAETGEYDSRRFNPDL